MNPMEETAVVQIDTDGGVIKCAKGLSGGECGYKAGAKVCGACGAMAVTEKAAMPMGDDMEDDMPEEGMEETKGKRMRSKKKGAMMAPSMDEQGEDDDEDEDDEDDDMAAQMMRRRQARMAAMAAQNEMPEEGMEDEEDIEKGWMMKPKKRSRQMAMNAMGVKSSEFADPEDVYLCRAERKVLSLQQDVCSKCTGGCAPEGSMPGLLDIEGMAIELFGGKVLSSVYADEADMFIVDVLAKDGSAVELIAEGSTGEIRNFHRIAPTDFGGSMGAKSLEGAASNKIIDIASAQQIALKALSTEMNTSGSVVQADSEIFEGYDSYVFEVDALNGKSYDVFIALNGTVLGYDEYDSLEAKQIEEEVAEISLKRAYSDEQRQQMADKGTALPDGSYPIEDETDLRNAIQAYGRSKDKEATKKHIMKRARSLGMEKMIPEDWMGTSPSEEKSATKDNDFFIKSLMEFEMFAIEEDLKDQF